MFDISHLFNQNQSSFSHMISPLCINAKVNSRLIRLILCKFSRFNTLFCLNWKHSDITNRLVRSAWKCIPKAKLETDRICIAAWVLFPLSFHYVSSVKVHNKSFQRFYELRSNGTVSLWRQSQRCPGASAPSQIRTSLEVIHLWGILTNSIIVDLDLWMINSLLCHLSNCITAERSDWPSGSSCVFFSKRKSQEFASVNHWLHAPHARKIQGWQ